MTANGVEESQQPSRQEGCVFLNGVKVGTVVYRGHNGAWGFGDFTPAPAFSEFATLFGRWSLLMHADNAGEKLSHAASDELRETERAIDKLQASIELHHPHQLYHPQQMNIDGTLIEWKEV